MAVSMTYTLSGRLIRATTSKGEVTTAVPVYACNGCGALVLDEDKATHNKFHELLAAMWDSLVR